MKEGDKERAVSQSVSQWGRPAKKERDELMELLLGIFLARR